MDSCVPHTPFAIKNCHIYTSINDLSVYSYIVLYKEYCNIIIFFDDSLFFSLLEKKSS